MDLQASTSKGLCAHQFRGGGGGGGGGGEGGSNIDVPFYIIENTRVEFTFSETAYFIKDFSINYVLCPSLFFFFFLLSRYVEFLDDDANAKTN